MYQTNNDESSEERFNALLSNFKENVYDFSNELSNETKFNMDSLYHVVFACAWNPVQSIGAKVRIIEKTDTMAIVAYNQDEIEFEVTDIGNCIFRLQDLCEVSTDVK